MEKVVHIEDSDTKLRILDAAEAEFSRSGYGGAGMKAIATEAGVAQGLLHYHYINKEGLYSAVVERRSTLICHGRNQLLDLVDKTRPDFLEQVFDAFFRPPLGEEGGGPVYARIFASLAVGGARDQALVAKHYDPTARKFIAALQGADPKITPEIATWSYSFAIGMLTSVIGRDGRAERLLGTRHRVNAKETEALIHKLVQFAVGGLRGMAGLSEGSAALNNLPT